MLWRYGLGPRPVNTDPNILIVEDLPPLDVLLPFECNNPGLKVSKVAQHGESDQSSSGPGVTGGAGTEGDAPLEEDHEQARVSSLKERFLTVAPLQQVPMVPKRSKFLLFLSFLLKYMGL